MVPCMHGMSRARTRELEPQAASLDAGSPEALGEQPTVGACHAQCSAGPFAEWSVQASSGSELGGYRRFLARSSESHRPARPRNLVVLRFAPIVACSRTQGGASTRGPPGTIACRGDRNENDARLSAPKGTDQPPYARCVEFDNDDDGLPEDYDSQYPPPQKWRVDFYLAAPGQPPALAGATRVGSHFQILEFVRSEVRAAVRVA